MNKEDFAKITSVLEAKVDLLDRTLGPITEDNSLECLSVKQLNDIVEISAKELTAMTNILMVDTYHIIGMGKLSPTQLSTFTRLLRTYCSYRPDLKAIVKWNGNIASLPKIPKRTKFKLLEFDLELINGRGGEIEEISETVDDYKNKTLVNTPAVTRVGSWDADNNRVCVPRTDIENFMHFIRTQKHFKDVPIDLLRRTLLIGGDYCGVRWASAGENIVGYPYNAFTNKLFKSLYEVPDTV
jgi:hypothetical protein